MATNTINRVAIYARVSTRDKGQEVENQLAQLREFSARQGLTIVREFVDRESGSTAERPEFQAMFRAASQRSFDVLLFWSLDRLSREGVLETLQHLNRLTAYGINYRSFTEQYFDSCGIFKDAVISILATIAKQERIRISERVRAGLDRARSRGKRLGRPRQMVDASQIADLRAQGTSWRKIARRLGISARTARRAGQNPPILPRPNQQRQQRDLRRNFSGDVLGTEQFALAGIIAAQFLLRGFRELWRHVQLVAFRLAPTLSLSSIGGLRTPSPEPSFCRAAE